MKRIVVAALWLGLVAGASFAQSAADGKKVFKKCSSCHKVGAGAKNRTGPVLTDVVDRPAASFEGYKYSKTMRAAGAAGLVWTEDNIFSYIENPTAFLRDFLDDPKARAKMTFKLKKESDRRSVIAYLSSFQTAAADIPGTGFCIVNAAEVEYVFATETREGVRQLATLQPGGQLCSDATQAKDGIVSVYKSADGFEGCSRIVAAGSTEKMLGFAEFDRCGWSSHNS